MPDEKNESFKLPKKEIYFGWTLHEELGRGGQSKVFKATKDEGKEFIALKKVIALYPKKCKRFAQEIKTHSYLSSKGAKNIIPVLEYKFEKISKNKHEGYIVMPLAKFTLGDKSKIFKGRIELSLEVFSNIVNGIVEAHKAKIIHRDIKPNNILFMDDDLIPYVSDFGICLLRDTPDEKRLTSIGETVGAKFFMAPEQEQGGIVDVKESADIYALGKLLNFMLTNQYIHREHVDEYSFSKNELENDPRLGIIKDEILLKTIIEKPEDRIQSAEELLNILHNIHDSFSAIK